MGDAAISWTGSRDMGDAVISWTGSRDMAKVCVGEAA